MNLGLVTKLDMRNKTTSKNLMMISWQQIVMSLSFFWFMANFEEARFWMHSLSNILQKLKKGFININAFIKPFSGNINKSFFLWPRTRMLRFEYINIYIYLRNIFTKCIFQIGLIDVIDTRLANILKVNGK